MSPIASPAPLGIIAKGFAGDEPEPWEPDPEFEFETTFHELLGYPQSEWRAGEFRAVRKLKCGWDDRMTLLAELNSAQGRLYPYPDGPYYVIDPEIVVPLAVAVSAKCEPLVAEMRSDTELALFTGQPVAEYDFALITVQYSNRGATRGFDGIHVNEKLGPRKVYESVVPGKLHWEDGGGPLLRQSIGRIFTGLEYVLTQDRMIAPPDGIMALAGQVNRETVHTYTLDMTFLPGTLLYETPTVEVSGAWAYQDRWKVVRRLGWHPWGWNNFYRPDGDPPGFYPLYLDDGTRYEQYPVAEDGAGF